MEKHDLLNWKKKMIFKPLFDCKKMSFSGRRISDILSSCVSFSSRFMSEFFYCSCISVRLYQEDIEKKN
jgi:hypothetical protein